MVALSKYEDAATAFLKAHPIGTTVTPDRMVSWATEHADGLDTDLLIGDPDKRLSALRRHLNNGASSRNLPEEKRFYLVIEDAKRKTMLVQSLVERTKEQADIAFDKSLRGAMSPITQSQRAIEDHKLEELSSEDREELEAILSELVESQQPLRNVLSQRNIDVYAKKLIAKGYSQQQAGDLLELMPSFSRFAKNQRLLG